MSTAATIAELKRAKAREASREQHEAYSQHMRRWRDNNPGSTPQEYQAEARRAAEEFGI